MDTCSCSRLLRQKLTRVQSEKIQAGAAVTYGLQRRKPGHVSFLDLPAEIRIEIYRLCLCRSEEFLPWQYLGRPNIEIRLSDIGSGRVGALLCVNKLIYQEALAIALTYNTFAFLSFRTLNQFFESIQQHGRTSLRDLKLCWWGTEGFEAVETCLSYLTQCTNLASLELCVTSGRGHNVRFRWLSNLSSKGLLVPIPSLKVLTLRYEFIDKKKHYIEYLTTHLLGHGADVQHFDLRDKIVYVVNQSQ